MNKIDGKVFRGMLMSGCSNLNNRRKEVDALNVFPVPDGDTGTNMSLTFTNGINEVNKSGSEDLPVVAKTLQRGLLMGARGNSGVILSQIFRGFYQSVGESHELDTKAFAAAMLNGAMLAYKAVMRPVEGTILTVVRESSDMADLYVKDHPEATIEEYMEILCKEARASLDRTPELLPILKEARVVDSGGSGLLAIFDGFKAYLDGAPIEDESARKKNGSEEIGASGYVTEFILKLSDQGVHLFKENRFRDSLSKLSENITVVNDADLVKVRVNTAQPGEVLNLGQRFGEFQAVQIDNLALGKPRESILENASKEEPAAEKDAEEKEYGIITVCAGEGLEKLFRGYRCDFIVSGGQTMNPSTEDFIKAIEKVHARHIFILPNNSNIIMAASQAAEVSEGRDVRVLPTKSIPQGLSACISFNPEADPEENQSAMMDAVGHVKTGQVTYAIKDTTVDGREIKAGDYMGILDKDIRLTSSDKVDAACRLISEMCDEDSEIVTLIAGKDASEEEVQKVQKYIEDHFEVDVDVEQGDQPVYCFIVGVE
ncbi:DAK2 domain-containing protein [Erysipelotrichaceae bacterium Oil+RF-744-GAM-WT-6]|uniref:DAK2 domain-containing protein n=1 Tax=Stecheria intestinalis TaxID=2606630 RepID=A0A7X2THK4_9FIRM|nr:DAK2 domain-containing protein [Stecheria intestinalis]MSS59676.1 DAK2 domain-containing protein [Stecheria intestinalis]